ncbi:helix-turn-helix protein [Nocardia puris]|uniref:Helix-turn-helix protein n=2 Tax=Nocardia puris TaxID=208602 RepID=A0A366DAB9_9NOCA|nr:helix-turn-helix protein [Nocardia puris]
MKDSESLGARVRQYAHLRNMTYAQLSLASNVSESMIKKVCSGAASPSTFTVGKLAEALRIDASLLRGDDVENTDTLDIVPVLRRTLAAIDLMDDDLEPEPVDQLAPLVAQIGKWRRAAKYRRIGDVLPDVVDRLLVAAREEGEPAYALLCDTYRAANSLAHKLGYSDLSMTATERMEWAASRSGDPLRVASVAYLKAATLARIGAQKQAIRLLLRAMDEIEPLVAANPTAAAVYSTLHMRAGTITATLTDADASRAHLAEAARLAARFPEGVVYDTVVGSTNVRLYQIAAEVDLGNPGTAIEIAKGTRLPKDLASERQTYFWLDTARAHLLNGDTDEAIEALMESRAAAPEHFRNSQTVKTAVRTAGDQQRRSTESLRSLANSAGILD